MCSWSFTLNAAYGHLLPQQLLWLLQWALHIGHWAMDMVFLILFHTYSKFNEYTSYDIRHIVRHIRYHAHIKFKKNCDLDIHGMEKMNINKNKPETGRHTIRLFWHIKYNVRKARMCTLTKNSWNKDKDSFLPDKIVFGEIEPKNYWNTNESFIVGRK